MSINMSSSKVDFAAVMMMPPPVFSDEHVRSILREHYSIDGEFELLSGERDLNYRVVMPAGEKRLLKIANSAEDRQVTNFQTRAFMHIAEADPDFPLCRVLLSNEGEPEVEATNENGKKHIVRMFSWLEGVPLLSIENRPDNPERMGEYLGRMGLALRDYSHPAEDNVLLWDLKHAASLADQLDYIDDETLQVFCRQQMKRFIEHTSPALGKLRSQVIFNDQNPSNTMVDANKPEIVTGFIDFGDMVKSPLVIDVATAVVYWCNASQQPLADVARFLKGYTSVLPLLDEELALLPDVILARAMIQTTIYHWRAKHFPENRKYIMRNLTKAREAMQALSSMDRNEAFQIFKNACTPNPNQYQIRGKNEE